MFSSKDHICILIEDHFSDCALEMYFKKIINLVSDFIYNSVCRYIISKKNDWIINITIEGDIYFSKILQDFINRITGMVSARCAWKNRWHGATNPGSLDCGLRRKGRV